ncbi:hypothetical protein SAMN03080617_04128 [Algoriphagus alkaliphilus]|uniref:Uncharacterized protein n=1 Tax=Algoriphagus alkaliphilus TaxID=279824 RepID=A0A1G5ZM16_9BACT|nr:hypothetical protein SAMN03080617_04128 [Algoriphagus alkaliphilus]
MLKTGKKDSGLNLVKVEHFLKQHSHIAKDSQKLWSPKNYVLLCFYVAKNFESSPTLR